MISVDTTDAGPGDVVKVSVDAADDHSGIAYLGLFYTKTNGQGLNVLATLNQQTNKYEADITISKSDVDGPWTLREVKIQDYSGNFTINSDSDLLSSGNFSVHNEDKVAPILNGITVDKQEAKSGETVTWSLDVTDEPSGVKSVEASIANIESGYSSYQTASYNEETNRYDVTMDVDENTQPGKWSIQFVDLTDNEGNTTDIADSTTYNWGTFDFRKASVDVVSETGNVNDTMPPVVKGVSVDKKEAAPEETVTVSVDAQDDLSGVKSVYVYVQNGYDDDYSGDAIYNEESGKYELKIPITYAMRSGNWSVYSITLADNMDHYSYNNSWDGNDFSAANFTVVPNDILWPTISGVSVDKKEAKPGDTVTISLDVKDDKSGVNSIYVGLKGDYDSTGGFATYNEETQKYELEIPVTETTYPGLWRIENLSIYDNAGNGGAYHSVDYDFSAAEFTVVNDQIDVAPPTISSVSVDKTEAKHGDTVTLSIRAEDDKSGVKSVYVYANGNYDDYSGYAEYIEETGIYEVKIPITEATRPGPWSISTIQIYDYNGNGTFYNNGYDDVDFSAANFTVNNDLIDVTPPTVQSMTVDKKEVQPGDTVKVSMDITDDKSEVSYVHIGYAGSHGGFKDAEAVYNSETQKYEAEITIDDETRPGTWKVFWIYVMDSSSNLSHYYPDDAEFTNEDFTVINEKIDINPPVINSVKVDKKEASVGDTVTLSINASDYQSEIDYMTVSYKMGTKYSEQDAVYNWMTGMYEVKITITDSSRPGTWSIDSIYVEDTASNWDYIYSGDNGVDFDAANFTVNNENADITPPTIQEVTVDKTEAKPDDTVKISIRATDDKSGVESIYVDLENSYYGYFYGEAIFNPETNQYEMSVPITDRTKPGLWSIEGISVNDNEDNSEYYENGYSGNDFSAANFNVTNENADITPPTITDVRVDQTEVEPGDTVTLSINATDDKSGVRDVMVTRKNSYGGYSSDYATYNESTNKFELQIPITDKTKSGVWSIDTIRLSDLDGNYGYFYSNEYNFSKANYTVINENADITPPELKSVVVDQKEVQPGETITVSVDAVDLSGIDQVNVTYKNEYDAYKDCDLNYNEETGKFEGQISITDTTYPGNWKIDSIYLSDLEENGITISSDEFDFSNADFHVSNDAIDLEAPTVEGVSVDKKVVNPGEEVTISVDAKDDKSGINEISLNVIAPNRLEKTVKASLNAGTGKYEAKLTLSNFAASGKWKVSSINLIDNEGNDKTVYNKNLSNYFYYSIELLDLSGADFTVTNPNEDITAPLVNSIKLNQDQFVPGEKAIVELDVQDFQSGVASVIVGYYGSNRGYYDGEAIYNEETQKYEFQIPIDNNTRPGTWNVDYITVTDNEGNGDYLFDGQYNLISGTFTVINENADVVAPLFKGISVDKKEAVVGDNITVSLDVTDEKSGISEVSVEYKNLNGSYLWNEAEWNPETNKYEFVIPVTAETKAGTWTVSNISVRDNEGNYQEITNDGNIDLSSGEFTVMNDQIDSTPPQFHGISVSQKVGKPGDDIVISIDATDDDSGVDSVYINLVGYNGGHMGTRAYFNKITQKYEAIIPITDTTLPGTWFVGGVEIYDNKNNELYLERRDNEELGNADFTVENNELDYQPPVIHSFSVDKKNVTHGQEVILSAEVTDDQSGVDSIYASYKNSDGATFQKELLYNGETGKYEAKIFISPLFRLGNWSLNYLEAHDLSDNGIGMGKDEFNDLIDGNFTVIEEDVTPPSAPTVNDVTDQSTKVTGTTEPGAEVSVKIGASTNTDKADDKGNFEVSISKQKAGTQITVFATDTAGNDSEEKIVVVEDVTPPSLTVSDVTDKSTTVTGVTEAGASVTVTIGTKNYTAKMSSNGSYTATISVQKAGTKVYVTAKDASENATNKNVTVLDKTAPSIPNVNSISDSTTKVTGTTEVGSTVTVTIGTKKYTGTADSKGSFTVTIPAQKAGTKLTVTATDASINTSLARSVTVLDKTAPSAPRVNSVSDKSKEVTGTTEASATVTVKIGTKSYTAKADTKGNFKVSISQQKAGTKLSITASDTARNVSSAKSITVIDKTAPSTPAVNTISDQSRVITGKAEASSIITVTIGTKKYTAKTDTKGNFKVSIPQQKAGTRLSVTAKDAAGNTSTAKSMSIIDKTAPAAPKVNTVKSSKSMTVTGKAEAYSSITIKVGKSVIGTGKADKYGKFKVKIKAKKKNTVLTITATDAAKNKSKAATIKVK
jgi:hypothetical protein